MKKILAKFVCLSVIAGPSKTDKQWEYVSMQPVISGSEENKSFSEATPSGSLNLGITNKDAWGTFEPNKEYFVTIEEAPAVAASPEGETKSE